MVDKTLKSSLLLTYVLDFNVLSTTQGHLRTTLEFKVGGGGGRGKMMWLLFFDLFICST